MAFRRFRGRSTFRGRGRRRGSLYETQNLSLCRVPLATGLSECSAPDQFLSHLASGRSEWESVQPGGAAQPSGPPIVAKGVVVRSIEFDYQYTYVPTLDVSLDNQAMGVCSIRSALVVLPIIDESNGYAPLYLPTNVLFFNEPTPNAGALAPIVPGFRNKVKILWRGMEMMKTNLLPTGTTITSGSGSVIPCFETSSRHVRVRVGTVLDNSHALYFLTEVVNPFLEDNPVIALDLLGKIAVKPMVRGQRYL